MENAGGEVQFCWRNRVAKFVYSQFAFDRRRIHFLFLIIGFCFCYQVIELSWQSCQRVSCVVQLLDECFISFLWCENFLPYDCLEGFESLMFPGKFICCGQFAAIVFNVFVADASEDVFLPFSAVQYCERMLLFSLTKLSCLYLARQIRFLVGCCSQTVITLSMEVAIVVSSSPSYVPIFAVVNHLSSPAYVGHSMRLFVTMFMPPFRLQLLQMSAVLIFSYFSGFVVSSSCFEMF